MTTFCEKCERSEHESCMTEILGKKCCRVCLIQFPNVKCEFFCTCGPWDRVTLLNRIERGKMLAPCDLCKKAIVPEGFPKIDEAPALANTPKHKVRAWVDIVAELNESVNHPSHYQSGKFEVIEIIEEFNLNFNLGNAIKYVLRAGKKDNRQQDLEKAKWYLERELKRYE